MKKYIQAYMNEINNFINNELSSADAERIYEVLEEFEIKISYFQHERLIHLIVTVLFAVLEIMAISVCLISPQLAALLVPYVMHYYFLENSVQEMYKMRDKIVTSLQSKK